MYAHEGQVYLREQSLRSLLFSAQLTLCCGQVCVPSAEIGKYACHLLELARALKVMPTTVLWSQHMASQVQSVREGALHLLSMLSKHAWGDDSGGGGLDRGTMGGSGVWSVGSPFLRPPGTPPAAPAGPSKVPLQPYSTFLSASVQFHIFVRTW